jgi:hypothetical protein
MMPPAINDDDGPSPFEGFGAAEVLGAKTDRFAASVVYSAVAAVFDGRSSALRSRAMN